MVIEKEREGIVEWVRRHKSAFGIAIAQGEDAEAGGAGAGAEGSTLHEPLLQRRLHGQIGNAVAEDVSAAQQSMRMTTCLTTPSQSAQCVGFQSQGR